MRPITLPARALMFSILSAAAFLQDAPKEARSGVVPEGMLSVLESSVHVLARAGREREMKELIATLEALGLPKAQADKLTSACEQEVSKANKVADALPDVAKRLRSSARSMAPLLAKIEGVEKTELAKNILRLDGSVEEAHVALGHEHVGESWVSREQVEIRTRRLEIQKSLAEAKALPVDVEEGESDNELLTTVIGRKGVYARWGGYILHSAYSQEKTTRILRRVLRALSLSNWLRKGGELALLHKASGKPQRTWILMDTKANYLKAFDILSKAGNVAPQDEGKARELADFADKKGVRVVSAMNEGHVEGLMLVNISALADGIQTALKAGHLNWLSMSCFDCSLPNFVYKETGSAFGDTKVADTAQQKKEREDKIRLSKAGLAGCRTFMAYLAENREDPPWLKSMEDQLGKVRGEFLLKTTSMVEFLQETGEFPTIVKVTSSNAQGKVWDIYAKALSTTIGDIETRWRAWILPDKLGIAQRVDKLDLDVFPDEAVDFLKKLNGLRAKGVKPAMKELRDVALDPELTHGANLHAEYLAENPEQAKEAPFEEYPEKDGYTSEGAWVASNAMIAPGGESPEDALDHWMGTFYQRLPLLEPGLMRIGYGWDHGYSVLDARSLSAAMSRQYTIAWPYDGQTGVPTGYTEETLKPVPEADEAAFGYPITLQVGITNDGDPAVDFTMKLYEGKAEVPCWFSSPSKPTNPEHAPIDASCLIPKSPLRLKTEYTVVAEWTGNTKRMSWSFKTN